MDICRDADKRRSIICDHLRLPEAGICDNQRSIMSKSIIKIAITGHVDHGKSTTIGRLLLETRSLAKDRLKELEKISRQFGKQTELAYLADQLKEERENNLTMDTTEIPFRTRHRSYCLIDTPGHLEFIKNMLTGASHADAALLVIDASQGIEEQTRRHAYLLKLLSLNNVIILLNKMDKLGYAEKEFQTIRNDITEFFRALDQTYSYLIPVSATENVNFIKKSRRMPWYRGPALVQALDRVKKPALTRTGPLRFPIQDIYEINHNHVAVGKIASGFLNKGQSIVVLPQGQAAVVSEIKVFGKTTIRAQRGESIGIILKPALDLSRGMIIASPESLPLCSCFKGNVFWMSDDPLKKGQAVTLRCATQEVPCTVKTIVQRIDPSSFETLEQDAAFVQKNEAAVIELILNSPAVLELFKDIPELGRFTFEEQKRLQGAGTILEKIA